MSDISYERRDGIAIATYNRPEVLNAFRHRTYDDLHEILKDFVADNDSKVLIITGSGRAFSAGQDLKELSATDLKDLDELERHLAKTQEITRLLYQTNKPSIAAINGLAVGAGIEIALACTVRIAVADSYFRFAEIERGLFQTNGALYFLPRLVGLGRAAQMLLCGDKISAQEALAAGLITRIAPGPELLSNALAIAAGFQQGSFQSLQLVEQGLRLAMNSDLEAVLQFEVQANLELIQATGELGQVRDFVDQHKSS